MHRSSGGTFIGERIRVQSNEGSVEPVEKLRDEAKEKLGPRFDIKAFHDAVLGNGAVSLPVLRQQVEAYIAAAAAAP